MQSKTDDHRPRRSHTVRTKPRMRNLRRLAERVMGTPGPFMLPDEAPYMPDLKLLRWVIRQAQRASQVLP